MRITILALAHDVYYSEPGNLLNITRIYIGITPLGVPVYSAEIMLVARFSRRNI
jgi:hypothetical protein